jgi:hypothetical protein
MEEKSPSNELFRRSIAEQIRLNQRRTSTERFQALCDLLDAARAMAPTDPEARQRRLRALRVREQDRERFRAYLRELIASRRTNTPPGV